MKNIFITVLLAITMPAQAQFYLPKIFGGGAVLQRDMPCKIWGWAAPGTTVSISFTPLGKKLFTTVTRGDSTWQVTLPPMKYGGPYDLHVKCSSGESDEYHSLGIYVGDVWICSGQSNMELTMERVKYKYPEEMTSTGTPEIRQFVVADQYNFNNPEKEDISVWQPMSKAYIKEFPAAAYFFAKEIYERYKIPIGLINVAVGGSPAEAWISEDGLKKFPAYYNEAMKFKNRQVIDSIETADRKRSSAWYNTLNSKDEGLKNNWRSPSFNDEGWKQMNIPGYWPGNNNGVVWFRKEFNIPVRMFGKTTKLELGRMVNSDSVFINGTYAGSTTYQYPPRRYMLGETILNPGRNLIVIRIVNPKGKGGFVPDRRYELTLDNDTVPLTGAWKYNTGATMPPLEDATFIRWKPLGLYNGMIAPIKDLAIKGVIWYQGETNTNYPANYAQLMQTLIEDWRSKWEQGNFPFLYVQLPNYMEEKSTPQESNWAELRRQQFNTLTVPNTGMAVAIDLGEWNELHPENKKDVGRRLALLAMRSAYGDKKIIASGPLYSSMKTEGNKIIISFTETGSGLIAKDGKPLRYFAIAGADKKFAWAKAEIKNGKVIVWSDEVKQPVAVRYAWADNPEGCNLYNKEGLPASPFTTEKNELP